jgi:hypothetical protein
MTDSAKLAKIARRFRQLGQFERAHFYETILIERGRCKRCGESLTDPNNAASICPGCREKAP